MKRAWIVISVVALSLMAGVIAAQERTGTSQRIEQGNWLRDPAMQRPAAHMPKLELTEAQIAVLAAFLASQE